MNRIDDDGITAARTAKQLHRLFQSKFAGKDRGRFRLGRRALLNIASAGSLTPQFLLALRAELMNPDLNPPLLLLDLRDTTARSDFVVISMRFLDASRLLPRKFSEKVPVGKKK